jgi:hypothetical protein
VENAIRACIYCTRLRTKIAAGAEGNSEILLIMELRRKKRTERDGRSHIGQNTTTALSIVIIRSKPMDSRVLVVGGKHARIVMFVAVLLLFCFSAIQEEKSQIN